MTLEPGHLVAGLRTSLLILLLVACGKDETSPTTTFPIRGDEGEEDFSAGVSIQCAPLGATVDVATSNEDLSPAGGAITDGRWVLTQSLLPDDEPVAGKKVAVFAFSGNEV